jgi:hypothetical protein
LIGPVTPFTRLSCFFMVQQLVFWARLKPHIASWALDSAPARMARSQRLAQRRRHHQMTDRHHFVKSSSGESAADSFLIIRHQEFPLGTIVARLLQRSLDPMMGPSEVALRRHKKPAEL